MSMYGHLLRDGEVNVDHRRFCLYCGAMIEAGQVIEGECPSSPSGHMIMGRRRDAGLSGIQNLGGA